MEWLKTNLIYAARDEKLFRELAPLAQLAAAMLGVGDAELAGERRQRLLELLRQAIAYEITFGDERTAR